MRSSWALLTCALLEALGCGEGTPELGLTVVNVSPVNGSLDYEVACGDVRDPVQLDPVELGSEDEVSIGNPCEFPFDAPEVCQILMDLPPGIMCTIRIEVLDVETRETCVQEEELFIAQTGDTEIDIVLDDCTVMPPPDGG